MNNTQITQNLFTDNSNVIIEISQWLNKGRLPLKSLRTIFQEIGITPNGILMKNTCTNLYFDYLFEDIYENKYFLKCNRDSITRNLIIFLVREPLNSNPIEKYVISVHNSKILVELQSN